MFISFRLYQFKNYKFFNCFKWSLNLMQFVMNCLTNSHSKCSAVPDESWIDFKFSFKFKLLLKISISISILNPKIIDPFNFFLVSKYLALWDLVVSMLIFLPKFSFETEILTNSLNLKKNKNSSLETADWIKENWFLLQK